MSRSFIQDVMEQPKVLESIASYYASEPGEKLLESARGLGGILKMCHLINFNGHFYL